MDNDLKLFVKVKSLLEFLEDNTQHRKQAVERACELVDEIFRTLERRKP